MQIYIFYSQERDIDRTVGINTGHVGTSDFKLEVEDRAFVVEVCTITSLFVY